MGGIWGIKVKEINPEIFKKVINLYYFESNLSI